MGPCEACLKAEAPKIGPTGSLPQDETLGFLDIWHCSVPAIFTGNRARIAFKHAGKSKFFKSTGCGRKSEAPEGVQLILAYFSSNGVSIHWIHSDCAPELKSGGVGEMCKERSIRVTTNVPGTSRANGVEPMFRVGRMVVAKLLARSLLPLCFHELAWCYFEEGQALKPSREPPHDCSLGRACSAPSRPSRSAGPSAASPTSPMPLACRAAPSRISLRRRRGAASTSATPAGAAARTSRSASTAASRATSASTPRLASC